MIYEGSQKQKGSMHMQTKHIQMTENLSHTLEFSIWRILPVTCLTCILEFRFKIEIVFSKGGLMAIQMYCHLSNETPDVSLKWRMRLGRRFKRSFHRVDKTQVLTPCLAFRNVSMWRRTQSFLLWPLLRFLRFILGESNTVSCDRLRAFGEESKRERNREMETRN